MANIELQLANYFFYTFHTALIIFNLLGWMFPKTQKLNLVSLLITFGSWLVLGIWKGWGYCFLTDWHYRILRALGETELPSSYIAFLIKKIIGLPLDAELVNWGTFGLAILALVCSLWVNLKKRK